MSAVDILHEIAENHDLDLKGNKTVVIGGGNVAVDVARSTKRSALMFWVCSSLKAERKCLRAKRKFLKPRTRVFK